MEAIDQEKLLRELGKGRQVRTVEEARAFYADLIAAGVNFHPDTPFRDYVDIGTNGTRRTFTNAEARKLEETIFYVAEACAAANVDPDEIALDELQKDLGIGPYAKEGLDTV